MADEKQCREEEYSKLEDLRISLDRGGEGEDEEGGGSGTGFTLCFWIYLAGSARPSSIILKQTNPESKDEVPFLVLNEENKLVLLPLMLIHEEAPSSNNPFPWTNMLHTAAEIDCPLEKWFHIGCQVAEKYMRLHVDGKLAGEKSLSLLSSKKCQEYMRQITLVGNDGNLGGYVFQVNILPLSASVSDQYVKNPPVKLSLDNSCILDGVEEGSDGVWSIVGGKASCRRNFSLEVVLLDAFGRSVHREMEVVASLLYADSGTAVEKTRDDAEAPLLTSCDGLEYPCNDRPVMLLRGRATFKLKISQLSSKCDNRLFRVCFHTSYCKRYPFLEAYSCPIRCISRNRSNRTLGFGKRSVSTTVLDEIHSLKVSDGLQAIRDVYGNGHSKASHQSVLKCSPPSKRYKVEDDRSTKIANGPSDQMLRKSQEVRMNNHEGTDSGPSDSESTDLKDSDSTWSRESIVSDVAIFKYCLEGTFEQSMLLKELIASASNEDIKSFAEQVCLYSGCSHYRDQILISKQLVQEGDNTWSSISHNKQRVLWKDTITEINKKFMSIANSTSRPLSGQDFEILHEIAGCGDDLGREEFDRMWYWLYPVAFALSKDQINKTWRCLSPKWIEGFITREEAESSFKGPGGGLQKAGTFVLRFPTSRSWPHPDAGSLVVTYIGTDSFIHHKLLSLDHRVWDSRLLQELLLEEPELSQLGRVNRRRNTSWVS